MSKRACHCCKGSGVESDGRLEGARMKKLRLAAGVSQKDLAREMGVSASMLVFLEKGERRWYRSILTRYQEAVENIKAFGPLA
jgi:DNA-binding XRE family transcriptional regulator